MNKAKVIGLVALMSVSSFAMAAYTGPQEQNKVSVAQLKDVADDQWVTLEGKLVKHLGGEKGEGGVNDTFLDRRIVTAVAVFAHEIPQEVGDYLVLLHSGMSRMKALAFNLLSTYVDWQEPHLFYGDPLFWFDHCKRNYSRQVALLHDYPLYEWTIVVRA